MNYELPKESREGDRHLASHNEMTVDVYRLIHATESVPVQEMEVTEFQSELDEECWTDTSGEKISPSYVIGKIKEEEDLDTAAREHPELAEHIRRLGQADYSHPIIVYNGHILDGVHRLAKAVVDGEARVKVKILENIPEEARVDPE